MIVRMARLSLQTIAIVILVGLQAVAFLWGFQRAWDFWRDNPIALWFLPAVGLMTVAIYRKLKSGLRSTSNILQGLKDSKIQLAWFASPFTICGTLVSQAFGASTGREGTAIHIGAGTTDGLLKIFPPKETWHRSFLVRCAIAAAFGSVFNTPLAATAFALESDDDWRRWRWTPYFMASAFGAQLLRKLFLHETASYPQVTNVMDPPGKIIFAVLLMILLNGICARIFTRIFLTAEVFLSRRNPYLVVFLCASSIVAITYFSRTYLYNDSGLTLIAASFSEQAIGWKDALMKSVFTILSATSGLKGGEVTPILSIGSAFGRAVASWADISPMPAVAIGCATFFGAVAGTPLTAALLAGEFFGPWCVPVTLLTAYLSSKIAGARTLYKIPY